VLLLLVDPSYI